MATLTRPIERVENRLLAALPRDEYDHLLPRLQQVSFDLGEVVYEFGGHLDYVYFPTTAIVSLLYTMENGASAEMGLTGNDGVVGIALFMGGGTMPNRAVVQSAGGAIRMKAKVLQDEFARGGNWSFRWSIDSFLESLAEDQRERAIGVILSGAGTDGTVGLKGIKAEGGITFAQDDSAKYNSMPRSAVAAGCVDFVLSPEYIAEGAHSHCTASSVSGPPLDGASPEDDRAVATAHENDESSLPP